MRVLHTSDWHLGASDNDKSLVDDQKHFIDEICDIADKKDVDVILIAGDVYDRSVASAEAIKLYDYAMTRLCIEMHKQVLVIAGNHDSAERLSDCKSLLEKAGLHVYGAIEREPVVVSIKDTDFYMMPWFTEEKVKGLFPEKKDDIKSLTDAFRVVCDAAKETFTAGRKHIAVSHAFITNASLSDSERSAKIAAVGTALQVDANVFDGFDYVALGHIHGPQNINDTVRYSGTPMAYSFGREEKQVKSVTIIDTEKAEVSVEELHPLHVRISLEGTYDEIMGKEYSDEVKNGYVKLKINDIYVGIETIAEIRKVFPNYIDISGKSYEGEDTGIRMTMEEFQKLEANPVEIFKSFCKDTIGDEPDEHLLKLFKECLESEGEE